MKLLNNILHLSDGITTAEKCQTIPNLVVEDNKEYTIHVNALPRIKLVNNITTSSSYHVCLHLAHETKPTHTLILELGGLSFIGSFPM